MALTEGFFGAADRLQTAMQSWEDKNPTFIALFETLNWWVAIDDRLRFEGHSWTGRADEITRALRYVRGRVHHQWANALELRHDVVMPRSDLGDVGGGRIGFLDSEPYTDWCWRTADELPPADVASHERGIDEYRSHLAKEPARRVIGAVSDSIVAPLWMASGGEQWPRR